MGQLDSTESRQLPGTPSSAHNSRGTARSSRHHTVIGFSPSHRSNYEPDSQSTNGAARPRAPAASDARTGAHRSPARRAAGDRGPVRSCRVRFWLCHSNSVGKRNRSRYLCASGASFLSSVTNRKIPPGRCTIPAWFSMPLNSNPNSFRHIRAQVALPQAPAPTPSRRYTAPSRTHLPRRSNTTRSARPGRPTSSPNHPRRIAGSTFSSDASRRVTTFTAIFTNRACSDSPLATTSTQPSGIPSCRARSGRNRMGRPPEWLTLQTILIRQAPDARPPQVRHQPPVRDLPDQVLRRLPDPVPNIERRRGRKAPTVVREVCDAARPLPVRPCGDRVPFQHPAKLRGVPERRGLVPHRRIPPRLLGEPLGQAVRGDPSGNASSPSIARSSPRNRATSRGCWRADPDSDPRSAARARAGRRPSRYRKSR